MRILLVEDEPSQQEALTIALTVAGHTVLQATDVQEAFSRMHDSVDAAILDVRLPDPAHLNRSGLTVLRELRARQPHVHIALLTGVPLTDAEDLITFDQIFDFLKHCPAQPSQ